MHIKVLKDLRGSAVQDAIDIKVLKDLRHGEGQARALREKRRLERSAGACPPRSLKQNEKRPQPKRQWTFAVTIVAWRGTGPRPTVRGHGLDNYERKSILRSYRP